MEVSQNNGTRYSEKEVTGFEIDLLDCYRQRGVGGASMWILLFSHVLYYRGMLLRGKRQDLTRKTCFAGLGKISDSGSKQVCRAQKFELDCKDCKD